MLHTGRDIELFRTVEFLTKLFNMILDNEEMPEDWRKSLLVPMLKKMVDGQNHKYTV